MKDVVRRHWDGRADTYDQGASHGIHSETQRDAWRDLLDEWAGPEPIDALDVGCGTGFLGLLLAGLGHRVVGVDVSEPMLERARAKAAASGLAIRFELADGERVPAEDGSFDLVAERHVLWTLPDPLAALTEWSRALRPGGRMVLMEGDQLTRGPDPDYAPISGELPLYGGRPADDLVDLVERAGLRTESVVSMADAALWDGVPDERRYAILAVAER